jgi:hypothetical protein
MNKHINASRDDIYAYEIIRSSGLTNMHDVEQVIDYSIVIGGPELTKNSIIEIQANYKKYMELYPLPANGIVKIKATTLKEEMGAE